jgi:cytidylate kinase
MARKYKAGPDVKPGEKVYDSKGNLIDQSYIDRAVKDVHHQVGRGRPSLTAPGAVSPEIKARVPAELKARVERAAQRQGKSTSAVVREALERHLEAS